MAVDYHSMRPIVFLLHSGYPYDSRLFGSIMEELQRKRIIVKETLQSLIKDITRTIK